MIWLYISLPFSSCRYRGFEPDHISVKVHQKTSWTDLRLRLHMQRRVVTVRVGRLMHRTCGGVMTISYRAHADMRSGSRKQRSNADTGRHLEGVKGKSALGNMPPCEKSGEQKIKEKRTDGVTGIGGYRLYLA